MCKISVSHRLEQITAAAYHNRNQFTLQTKSDLRRQLLVQLLHGWFDELLPDYLTLRILCLINTRCYLDVAVVSNLRNCR